MQIAGAYIRAIIAAFFLVKNCDKKNLVDANGLGGFKIIFALLAKIITFFIQVAKI